MNIGHLTVFLTYVLISVSVLVLATTFKKHVKTKKKNPINVSKKYMFVVYFILLGLLDAFLSENYSYLDTPVDIIITVLMITGVLVLFPKSKMGNLRDLGIYTLIGACLWFGAYQIGVMVW